MEISLLFSVEMVGVFGSRNHLLIDHSSDDDDSGNVFRKLACTSGMSGVPCDDGNEEQVQDGRPGRESIQSCNTVSCLQ